MKSPILLACFAALALMFSPLCTQAATPSETLEKGIYHEETTGNLDEAIKNYRQVLRDAQKTQALAAQAQYRLGRCLLKQGKQAEAEEALKALIENYPKETKLIAEARKLLPGQLELAAPMWKSGESLAMTMSLPGGQTIGVLGVKATLEEQGDKNVWRFSIRRHISGGGNSGISSVLVDAKTNHPLETSWNHTLLGAASAKWSADKITISKKGSDGKTEKKVVELDSPGYANDQVFYVFRQLPLKVGYKTTIPVRVAFTGGNSLGIEVNVAKKEKIGTPVGEFECFRLDTNIAQTFWITNTPERYIARFDAGGVTALLSEVGKAEAEEFSNEELGYAFTKPAGWYMYAHESENPKTSSDIRLVAPDSIAWIDLGVKTKEALEGGRSESNTAWVDAEIRKVKAVFGDVTVREDSRTTSKLAGEPAEECALAFKQANRPVAGKMVVSLQHGIGVEMVVAGDADTVEKEYKAFESFRKSFKVNRE